jgi:hypothetical protein
VIHRTTIGGLMSTTVLLVDDHELIRNGLRLAFERHPTSR